MKEKKEWLARLMATDQLGPNDVEEIEGHLEESIAELTQLGLTEKESFLVAAERMGHPVEIGEGFENVGILTQRAKILLYVILGGMLVPLLSVLSGFLSALLVLAGAHMDWLRFEDFSAWISVLDLVIYGLLLTAGVWAILSQRSPLVSYFLKLSACRWLFSITLLLYLAGVGLMASGRPAIRQLALRELTPPEHVSHLPGVLNFTANGTQMMLWLSLTIAVPRLMRMKNEKTQSL